MTITVVDYPTKLPAKCLNCGSPYSQDYRKFLDLHIDVTRYGRLYFCTLCFAEAAGLVGYIEAARFDAVLKSLELREAEIDKLEDDNGNLRLALASLGVLGILPGDRTSVEDVEEGKESTVVDSTERDEESVVHPSTGERDTEDAESGSSGQSDVRGSFDLPALVEIAH